MARPERPSGAGPQVFWEWLGVLLAAAALVLILALTGATTAGDNLVYDQFLRLHGHTPLEEIVVVAIDDASLAAYGAWPWPRRLHARLIDKLTDAGAAAVGYDVLFIEPDPASGDAALAAALRRSDRTALPVLELSPGDDGRPVKIVRPLAALATAAARLGQVSLALDGDGVARRFSQPAGHERCLLAAYGDAGARHRAPKRSVASNLRAAGGSFPAH